MLLLFPIHIDSLMSYESASLDRFRVSHPTKTADQRRKRQELEDFVGAKFYSPHAFAGGNQHIRIRKRTLEFSSTVLSTLSRYCELYKQLDEIRFI